ncbi:3390_t:CDS:1, partial [Racocetra persica]
EDEKERKHKKKKNKADEIPNKADETPNKSNERSYKRDLINIQSINTQAGSQSTSINRTKNRPRASDLW